MGSVFKRTLKQLNQQEELVMNSAKQVAEVMNVHFQPDEKSPLEFRKTIWLKDISHKGRKKN